MGGTGVAPGSSGGARPVAGRRPASGANPEAGPTAGGRPVGARPSGGPTARPAGAGPREMRPTKSEEEDENPEGAGRAERASQKSGEAKGGSKPRRTAAKGKEEDFDIEIVDLDDMDL